VKTQHWLIVLAALFLPACGTQPVRDDSPASDLAALKANAERHLAPRTLPNGKVYCVELAETERAQDDCALDLEDLAYLSEQDKARALVLIRQGVKRLELSRLPTCKWYQLECKGKRRAIEEQLDSTRGPP
jgi:hypothetical protein